MEAASRTVESFTTITAAVLTYDVEVYAFTYGDGAAGMETAEGEKWMTKRFPKSKIGKIIIKESGNKSTGRRDTRGSRQQYSNAVDDEEAAIWRGGRGARTDLEP
ncbi:hypothetical protein EYF80_021737 [Liparis tanakae]|uniref:Uncharacterized protein n=1 Tax=Liparis tanakae TaxID=230148 RepID=A0A4Z2HTA6_9TELE|nr:hypothetical protein EYF80_021737 [Liparis tanakae]